MREKKDGGPRLETRNGGKKDPSSDSCQDLVEIRAKIPIRILAVDPPLAAFDSLSEMSILPPTNLSGPRLGVLGDETKREVCCLAASGATTANLRDMVFG